MVSASWGPLCSTCPCEKVSGGYVGLKVAWVGLKVVCQVCQVRKEAGQCP